MDPSTALLLYSAFESWKYFNVMFINTFSRNKRRKNCEESRCNVNVNVINGYIICQNLIGSYISTHSSFNLIGPRNKYPNIQIYKDRYQAHTLKPLTDELFIAQKWASLEGQSQDRPQGAYFSSSFRRKNRKYPTNFICGRFHQLTEPVVRYFLKLFIILFREMLITVY